MKLTIYQWIREIGVPAAAERLHLSRKHVYKLLNGTTRLNVRLTDRAAAAAPGRIDVGASYEEDREIQIARAGR